MQNNVYIFYAYPAYFVAVKGNSDSQ